MRSFPPGQSVVTILMSPRPAAKASSGIRQVGGVDPEARQRAARPQDAQGTFEGRLRAQRLDGDIDAAAIRQFHDGFHRIAAVCNRRCDRAPSASRHGQPLGDRVDADDGGRAHQARACRGAQADRSLAKTATVSPMRTLPLSAPEKPVDMMSGHISTCSSVSRGRHRRQIGHRVGHQHELRLAAVDGVAELPAAHRLEAVAGSGAVL